MNDPTALDSFTGKWRERWPEWAVVEVFVPPPQRDVAVAWFALLQELADAAWGGEDPTPGLAKLAWWVEELRGWGKGARRHPLGTVLCGRPVDWSAFAASLPALRDRDAIRGPVHALLDVLRPFADAIVQVEQALFGGSPARADAVAAGLVSPWHLDSAERAVALLPVCEATGSRPRRLLTTIVAGRLQRARDGQAGPASRWRVLWRGWAAARGDGRN